MELSVHKRDICRFGGRYVDGDCRIEELRRAKRLATSLFWMLCPFPSGGLHLGFRDCPRQAVALDKIRSSFLVQNLRL